jgi:hypothetical protein
MQQHSVEASCTKHKLLLANIAAYKRPCKSHQFVHPASAAITTPLSRTSSSHPAPNFLSQSAVSILIPTSHNMAQHPSVIL